MILGVYLRLYYFFAMLYHFFLNIFGPIRLVYYFDGERMTNITFWKSMWPKSHGVFYVKTYHSDETYHLAYKGHIDHLNNFSYDDNVLDLQSRRKNIVLLDGSKTLNFDLNFLDNYRRTIQSQSFHPDCEPVKDLQTVLKIFNCNATDIQIINLAPFRKQTISITEGMDINMLYE
jgi:hypothetical protein